MGKYLKDWYAVEAEFRYKEPRRWTESASKSLRRMLFGSGLATIASCCLTRGLWVAQGSLNRTLPNIPLLPILDIQQPWIHSFLSLLAIFILPLVIVVCSTSGHIFNGLLNPDSLLRLQIIVNLLVVAMDVFRLQTWLYIYTMMCVVCVVFLHELLYKKGASIPRTEDMYVAITLCRVIVCSVWMHSGLLKFNPNYPYGDFASITPLFERIPQWLVYPLAYSSALFETLLGVFPMTVMYLGWRTAGSCVEYDSFGAEFLRIGWFLLPIGAVAMHLFICIRLLYQNYEVGVVPWNLAFMCYTYYLFVNIRSPFPSTKRSRIGILRMDWTKRVLFRGVIVVFVFMPLLAAINMHHCYLSFSMYTTNDPALLIFTEKTDDMTPILPRNNLVFQSAEDLFRFRNCGIQLKSSAPLYYTHNWDWGFADTGASLYPSFWSYKQLAAKTCKGLAAGHKPIIFIIVDKLAFPYVGKQNYHEIVCSPLGHLTYKSAKACKPMADEQRDP